MSADHIISGMNVTMGDRNIQTKIIDKDKANEKYENAVASGNHAVKLSEAMGQFLEL